MEHHEAAGHAVTLRPRHDLVGVGGAAAHRHDGATGAGHGCRLDEQHEVLTLLDAAHIQYILLRQSIAPGHGCLDIGRDIQRKGRVATLIDDIYLGPVDAVIGHYVTLGTFADGYDTVALDAGTAELAVIDAAVDGFVIGGIAQEYQVVDGDNAPHAPHPRDARRQLIAQTVEKVYPIAPQVGGHPHDTPEGRARTPHPAWRHHACSRRQCADETVLGRRGDIEQIVIARREVEQRADDEAAVVAQPGGILGGTFGVKSYSHACLFICHAMPAAGSRNDAGRP